MIYLPPGFIYATLALAQRWARRRLSRPEPLSRVAPTLEKVAVCDRNGHPRVRFSSPPEDVTGMLLVVLTSEGIVLRERERRGV